MIGGDSIEYELLEKCCKLIKNENPFTCEIGVRLGKGSQTILESLKNKDHWHIGVDPYGDLKYQHYDDSDSYTCDYTDVMRDKLLVDFARYQGKFHLANMKDTEFMATNGEKRFALVHFDGPHMTKDAMSEAIWFASRAARNSRFIFDDYPKYNMQLISNALKPFGFNVLEQGKNKICLEKTQSI